MAQGDIVKSRENTTSKEKSTSSDLKGTESFNSATETTVNKEGETKQALKLFCH